jgi:hypothetical protein
VPLTAQNVRGYSSIRVKWSHFPGYLKPCSVTSVPVLVFMVARRPTRANKVEMLRCSRSLTQLQVKTQVGRRRCGMAVLLVEKPCFPRQFWSGLELSSKAVHGGINFPNSPNIIHWPLKITRYSPLSSINCSSLLSPGSDIIIFNNISVSAAKLRWMLIQCLTLLHLAETCLGSIKILLHTDYSIVHAQLFTFSNLLSIFRLA